MAIVFHEIEKDNVDNVLRHGLKLGNGGEKRDGAIDKTDELLDARCPADLRRKGLNRQKNNYCYLNRQDMAVDITDGSLKEPPELVDGSKQALLQLDIDPDRCYVSNLDTYDAVKKAVEDGNEPEAKRLVDTYWGSLQVLSEYLGNFGRPEVMVTYDVPPAAISRVA